MNETLRLLYDRFYTSPSMVESEQEVETFICGFRLAWEMANELKRYLEERPEPEDDLGPDALA